MDALSQLFTYFSFRTDLFFIGQLCQIGQFNQPNKGYLHFIQQGRCWLNQAQGKPILIDRPSIILSPTHILHSIHPDDRDGVQIFCISFDFGEGTRNPITQTLQHIAVLKLTDYPALQRVAEQIFVENQTQDCGYQAAVHHLCAYFTIQVIRCCLRGDLLKEGVLKGLSDKQLAPLLADIHRHPERDWQVEEMAKQVGMSRSRFADYFKKLLGISPMQYLTNWRITMAQNLLQKGLPVALVAERVGYSHNAALTRVFVRELGISPSEWLQQFARA